MWKGSISFGLVNIPVEMYLASRERPLKFTLLHDADYSPIRYARICKDEEKEVTWSHVVKGIESEEGKFTVISEEDLKNISKERSTSLDIKYFANQDEIDSIFFERPYYLEPQKGASKAYALLATALEKSKKVGIATYVIHNREHLGVIKANQGLIILNQLRYNNEIVKMSDLKIPKISGVTKQEIEIGLQLIETMSQAFRPEDFKDSYNEELKKIIKAKSKGLKIKAPSKKAIKTAKVYDLMSVLKKSVEQKAKKRT